MATLTKDDVWKVVQMGLAMLVVPLGGWVWNMNVQVSNLENDLGDAERTIVELQSKTLEADVNAKQIIGIERDMAEGFMRVVLSDNDYDPVSATTSNATQVTADIDSTNLTVSFGRSF